ncbi:hypothetical protein GGF31_004180 [Allomyces arbusculus]|nr:hypothetical protein GGF31_004180 [Allomyces arbusculus]
MVSDFFFPNVGGIESHLYCLSQELLLRGHKVIIVTHAYDRAPGHQPSSKSMPDRNTDQRPRARVGIRWLTNGLKVYYLPQIVLPSQASFPTIFGHLAYFRDIMIRERIQLVHGHQAFSSMCLEYILHARTMGLNACFTDHSLFGFNNTGAIMINKVLKFVLSDVDHVICVSHTSRENTVLRAALNPTCVSVIPNAVIADDFLPDPKAVDPNWVTIVCVTRLVYNKGADLLTQVIPRVCAALPNVRFIIAGDGAKRVDLEQMREQHVLQSRVQLLGAVPHAQVRSVLVQGQIFLNTSLIEAFGTAMVEAACAGLHVVSTRVGGVPEILPRELLTFCDRPHPVDLSTTLIRVVRELGPNDLWATHRVVRDMYAWSDVAARTENVYRGVVQRGGVWDRELVDRLVLYRSGGLVAGLLFCLAVTVDLLLLNLLEWWRPRDQIDVVPDFHLDKWRQLHGDGGDVGPPREEPVATDEPHE